MSDRPPSTARAYRLKQFGSLDGIQLEEEQRPEPASHEILLRVRAASLNRRDLMILHQRYPLPPVLGVVPVSDGASEVVAVGPQVTRFKAGDRAIGNYFPRWRDGRLGDDQLDQLGCTIDGMLAEYVILDEEWATQPPDHLSWQEAATLPCAGLTAWNALTSGALTPGQTVLTIGTGSVSTFAIQFARLMGLRVIAVTTHGEKTERLTALGADQVIDSAATPEWGSRARELTGGAGVDLVVETRGPDTIQQSLIASARYVQIVLLITENPRARDLVIPGHLYARKLTTIRRIFVGNRASLEQMITAITAAKLHPVIDRTFAFTDARDAYMRTWEPATSSATSSSKILPREVMNAVGLGAILPFMSRVPGMTNPKAYWHGDLLTASYERLLGATGLAEVEFETHLAPLTGQSEGGRMPRPFAPALLSKCFMPRRPSRSAASESARAASCSSSATPASARPMLLSTPSSSRPRSHSRAFPARSRCSTVPSGRPASSPPWCRPPPGRRRQRMKRRADTKSTRSTSRDAARGTLLPLRSRRAARRRPREEDPRLHGRRASG